MHGPNLFNFYNNKDKDKYKNKITTCAYALRLEVGRRTNVLTKTSLIFIISKDKDMEIEI
jgi:hypothetical protein